MFNVSCREKTTMRERMNSLTSIDVEIKACKQCLCKDRITALSGRFVEPSDAIIIDVAPHEVEDKAGVLLAGNRDKGFSKLFSIVRPCIDINRVSYITAFKCVGSSHPNKECLNFLDRQISAFDPVLIISFGEDMMQLISGRSDLELGKAYVTGGDSQYLLFGLLHPRSVLADKDKNMSFWKHQLESLVQIALKYDLKILR